jgi:hypothetical protein
MTASGFSSWSGQSMKQKCECHECKAGGTSHNDDSHDQSLDQKFEFLKGDNIRIVGGTTKCARVAMRYFQRLGAGGLRGRKVFEFGSGTGLVGIRSVDAAAACGSHIACFRLPFACSLAHLGARMVMTDQSLVMELLEANIEANNSYPDADGKDGKSSTTIQTAELFWCGRLCVELLLTDLIDLRRGDEKMMAAIKDAHGVPDILIGALSRQPANSLPSAACACRL